MNYSRRRVVASAAALPLLGLAGCNSQQSPSDDPGSNDDSNDDSESGETTEDATSTETATSYASPLARDTASVFDEVTWFANHYNTTLYQYRGHVDDVNDLISSVRSSSTINESNIADIRSRTDRFTNFVQNRVASHFNETGDIPNRTRLHLDQAEKFRRRDDDAALQAEIDRLGRFYNGLGLDSFVQSRLSGRPIKEPLHSYLRAADLGSDTAENPVFVVGHPASPFLRPCRVSSAWNFDLTAAEELKTAQLRTYFDGLDFLFAGIQETVGRVDRVYAESFTKSGPRRSRPIYVQRYEDAGAAESALSSITERTTGEGTTDTLGRPTWHRLFYKHDIRMNFHNGGTAIYDVSSDTVYGPRGLIVPVTRGRDLFDRNRIQREQEPGRNLYLYVARVGRHVVAISPSTLAWEQRPTNAEDAIRNSWLWA